MKVCKRILAVLILLVAAVGLLLSLAGGVGAWMVKAPVTEGATSVFERIEAALKVADESLGQVKASLARAAERLDSAREEQRTIAQNPPRGAVLKRRLARTVQQRIAPELGDAHEKLHTVAEAAVVVNSILEDVGSFPFLSITGLDVSSLREMNNSLSNVGPAAWELSRLFGGQETGSDAAASDQLSRIQRIMKTLRRLVAEYEPRLQAVRQRTEELKSRTLSWITPATVLVSAVCFWIALSQVSLMAHAWSWCRRSGPDSPGQRGGQ
jgi:hypothetical protein